MNSNDNIKLGDVIRGVVEMNNDASDATAKMLTKLSDEEPITLDDILNVFDGIRETPGRIIVITSNHYDKLDPALIRPGRIDISLELSNASHEVISQIYYNFFKEKIDKTKLKKIKENFYSPAEINNIYLMERDAEKMINRLIKNKHV